METNGIYVARKTEDGIQSVHIPQEVAEFAHLNQQIRAERIAREREEAWRRKERQKLAEARKAEEREKRRAQDLMVRRVCRCISVAAIAGIAYAAEWIAMPVMLLAFIVCAACAGAAIGRWAEEWR